MRRLASILAIALVTLGCGGSRESLTGQDPHTKAMMTDLGEMIGVRNKDAKKPPTKVADLSKYAKSYPSGFQAISDGSVIVEWGKAIKPDLADNVLAYEKQTPESSGFVVMQDGTTVKKLSASEFEAAK